MRAYSPKQRCPAQRFDNKNQEVSSNCGLGDKKTAH